MQMSAFAYRRLRRTALVCDGLVSDAWPCRLTYSATLKGRQTEKKTMSASEILSDLGNHKFEILRRDGSGAGELHQNWTDIFIVQSGEGTILYGGSIEDAKDTGNGEIRGPRHVGGKSQKVTAGDVLVIRPASPIKPSSSRQILLHAHRESAAVADRAD